MEFATVKDSGAAPVRSTFCPISLYLWNEDTVIPVQSFFNDSTGVGGNYYQAVGFFEERE